MSNTAERYRKVAGQFTRTADGVPDGAWDNPAPCEGWVARDVVRHLVEWFPPFLQQGAGLALPSGPSVDEDPAASWRVMSDGVQAVLDDPTTESRRFSHPQAGEHALPDAIDMFFLGDVLIHTWDLARATEQDETLDRAEVEAMFAGIQPFDEVLRSSGHYGPRVTVPDDADVQTKLIAFTGRQP